MSEKLKELFNALKELLIFCFFILFSVFMTQEQQLDFMQKRIEILKKRKGENGNE